MKSKRLTIAVYLLIPNLYLLIPNSYLLNAQGVSINNDGAAAGAGIMLDIKGATDDNSTYGLQVKNNSGTSIVAVRSDGNVGVGTANPGRKFVVRDEAAQMNIQSGDGESSVLNLGDESDDNIGRIEYNNINNGMFFRTNNADAMMINSNGNVGVGTATPMAGLDIEKGSTVGGHLIVGASNEGGRIIFRRFGGSLLSGSIGWQSAADDTVFSIINNSGNGILKLQTNNSSSGRIALNPDGGNVGIGSTTPDQRLQVIGDIRTNNVIGPEDGAWGIYTDSGYLTGAAIQLYGTGSSTPNRLTFWTGSTLSERMRIDPNGNVGIGITTPDALLTVNGTARMGSITVGTLTGNTAERGNITYNGATATFQINGVAGVHTSIGSGGTSDRLFVRNSGNVGIGTTTPSHLLHVTGIARSTQTTWAISSDKRVKTKIHNLNEGLNTILKIRPVEFEYSKKYKKYNDGYEGKKRGFIAQEIKEILPDMITITEEKIGNEIIKDFHLLSNNDFTPILIKAIQEQQQIIEIIKKENELLKKAYVEDITQVKDRIKQIEGYVGVKAKR